MNKIVFRVLVLSLVVSLAACSGKTEKAEDQQEVATNNDEWPQMDEFHMIMAESFHPYKDSANLDPARANAAEMVALSERWVNAALPEKVNNDEVKGMLQDLKSTATSFSALVTANDTTAMGESLTKLHDNFHRLQEAWYAGGKEDGHDHEHEH